MEYLWVSFASAASDLRRAFADRFNTDSLLGEPSRSHGTRRMRGGPSRMHASRPHLSGNEDSDLAAPNGTNGGHTSGSPAPESSLPNGNGSSNPSWATGGTATDPFNLAATFLPSGNPTTTHPLLSSLAGTSSGSGGILSGVGKRKPGPRAQPGLPPAHYSVTSGTYAQFGKSLAGLSGLRGEEVEGDLGEVRRKRARNAGGGGRGRRGVE